MEKVDPEMMNKLREVTAQVQDDSWHPPEEPDLSQHQAMPLTPQELATAKAILSSVTIIGETNG